MAKTPRHPHGVAERWDGCISKCPPDKLR